MSFKSRIYDREEIEEDTSNLPLVFLMLLAMLLGYLLTDLNGTLGWTIMILSIIATHFYLYKDWGRREEEGRYVGELVLTGDLFTLDKESFRTSEISDLKIEIGFVKGDKHWGYHGYTVDGGTRSKLEFTVNGQRRHYNFMVFSEGQVKNLRPVLEELYTKGILVKEFYMGNRTYLLENLDYDDIQEFKKKYKLS